MALITANSVGRERIEVVEHGKEEWYEVRTVLDWSQVLECSSSQYMKMGTADPTKSGEKVDMQYDLVLTRKKRLLIMLLAWSHPQPITPETVGMIPVETGKILFPKIDEIIKAQGTQASADPLPQNSNT